jgi:hypothetical protein
MKCHKGPHILQIPKINAQAKENGHEIWLCGM